MNTAAFAVLDFDRFHAEELPRRLAEGNGILAARDLSGVAPITFELTDGRAVSYVPVAVDGAGTVEVVEGVASDTGAIVVLDPVVWSDFVHELRTSYGLLYAGSVAARAGRLEHLIRWEPALRAMFSGRPIYDPATLDLRDRDGAPLDLQRSFTLDDHPCELGHFMRQTGFAHVRGVVEPAALSRLVTEVDRLQALARPGDDRSWWARHRDGHDVVCRLTYVGERSEELAAAHTLPGLSSIVQAVAPDDTELAVRQDRSDGHSVVIKNPDVVDGLSDLPWHIDCGLGGHPVLCPSVLIGIQLEGGSRGAGQLRFLAGSWKTSCHQLSDEQITAGSYPVVALDTAPGDVTVHYGHGMHVAPAPTGAADYRRTLYVSWNNVAMGEVVPPGAGYNDVVLRSGEDNRVLSVPEQLTRT